jgi:hypothetical protein
MRPASGIVIVALSCALAGCGASARDEVQAKVQQFAKATASGDYRALCEQVLAPSLLQRLSSAGLGCEAAMKIFVASVQDPTLSVARIRVTGKRASAVALTAARGQRAALETIELTDTKSGWRVVSLGSPATADQRAPSETSSP